MNNFKKSENPLLLLQVLNVLNNLCEIKELTDSLSIYLYLNYLNELTVNKECRGNNNCKVLDDSNSVNYAMGWSWSTSTSEDTVLAEYEWNEENRLTKASVNNTTAKYTYNAGGQRVHKHVEDKEEILYVDNLYELGIGKHKDSITKHVFVGSARIVSKISFEDLENNAEAERRNTFYHSPDHLGSSNVATNFCGELYKTVALTPYGELWIEDTEGIAEDTFLDIRYTDKPIDEETGLCYFGARYYDPKTSLWISPDPALDDLELGYGLYTYCTNNPIIYRDPKGKNKTLNILGDLWAGVCDSVIENETRFLDFFPEKIRSQFRRVPGDSAAYYSGRLIGDLICIVQSIIEINLGLQALALGISGEAGSIAANIVPGAGQAACAVGSAVSITVIIAGCVLVVHGATVVLSSVADIQKSVAMLRKIIGNRGDGPKHGGDKHNEKIDRKVQELKNKDYKDIRKNQAQIDANGNKVGNNRPDVQGTNPNTGQREYFEFDTNPKSSVKHGEQIINNDPNGKVILEILE